MEVCRIKYALKDLQNLSEKLSEDLRIDNKGVNEILSIMIFFREGNIDLETAIKDLDSIYETELIFRG
ncbi:MAG: hypothetical protein ACLFTY_01745 [Candidatus Aenigmatarchaeota archaeon]